MTQPPSADADAPAEHAGERQCGRCRQWFAAEAGAHATALADWWVCPPCHVVLFGAPKAEPVRTA